MENSVVKKVEQFLRAESLLPEQITGDFSTSEELAANIDVESKNLWNFLEGNFPAKHAKPEAMKAGNSALTFIHYRQPEAGEHVLVVDLGGTNLRQGRISFISNHAIEKNLDLMASLEDYTKEQLGLLEKPLGREELFTRIANKLKPLLQDQLKNTKANGSGQEAKAKPRKISLCFSHPISVRENKGHYDAYPLYFTKERKANDLVGVALGAELNKYLQKLGVSEKQQKVVVLNDTVAIALAGLWELQRKANKTNKANGQDAWHGMPRQEALASAGCFGASKTHSETHSEIIDTVLGVVLGTGFNIAYLEPVELEAAELEAAENKAANQKSSLRGKGFSKSGRENRENNSFLQKRMMYNSEIGGYRYLHESEVDRRIRKTADEQDLGFSEKRISGAYFAHIFHHSIELVLEKKLLHGKLVDFFECMFAKARLAGMPIFSNNQLSSFLASGKIAGYESELAAIHAKDKEFMRLILEKLVKRSAKMAAFLSAGVLRFSLGQRWVSVKQKTAEKLSFKRAAVSLEGSFVKNFPGLKKAYLHDLYQFMPPNIALTVLEVDNASMVGAAMADWSPASSFKYSRE